MSTLRVITRHEAPPRLPVSAIVKAPGPWRWVGFSVACCASLAACVLVWWVANADTRAIRALPDAQRIPLYERTIQNLKAVCDPAAPRSLRDFCHKEADLVLRFRECDADRECQELARRHIPHPYR